MWMIELPLRVATSKRKQMSLNLNIYRNLHYQTLNKAKQNFAHLVLPRLAQVPTLTQCYLHYVIYPATRQLLDIANVGAIVDKFFSDTLVEAGILADDNYQVVRGVSYGIGQVDRRNPRVEAFIHRIAPFPPTPKENQTMQIVLKKEDLEALILEHVSSYMNPAFLADKDIVVEFTEDDVLVDFVSETVDTPAKTRDSVKKPSSRRTSKADETRSTPPPTETRPTLPKEADEAATAKSVEPAKAEPKSAPEPVTAAAETTDETPETAAAEPQPAAFKSLFGHLTKPENK